MTIPTQSPSAWPAYLSVVILSGCLGLSGCQRSDATNSARDVTAGATDQSDVTATDNKATDNKATDNKATDNKATKNNEPEVTDEGGETNPPGSDVDLGQAGVADGGTDQRVEGPPLDPPKGMIRVSEEQDVWIDKQNKRVVVHGEICLREGTLELFACEVGMKTHESVIALKGKPSVVHAALLAIGAKQGKPVSFEPSYKPATGDEIEITVQWTDQDGKKHEVRGQEMVRDVKTRKAMTHSWVFAGSGFWKDQLTKKEIYMGDSSGDFICVSNFPSAVLDLPIESSASNEGLLFEAFTENIPLLGTKVRMTLQPRKASD